MQKKKVKEKQTQQNKPFIDNVLQCNLFWSSLVFDYSSHSPGHWLTKLFTCVMLKGL